MSLRLSEMMHGRLRSSVDVGSTATHGGNKLDTKNRGPCVQQTVHRHSYMRSGIRICCGKSVKEIDTKDCDERAANIFNNRI